MAYKPKVGDRVQYIAEDEVVAIEVSGTLAMVKILTGKPKDQFIQLPIEILMREK